MRMFRLAFLAVLFIAASMSGQSSNHLTIAKGAVTNGTALALQELDADQNAALSGSTGSDLSFLKLNSDILTADSFFEERFRTVRADEILCAEPWFGRGLACKKNAPTTVVAAVVTKPMSTIYGYWMDRIRADTVGFTMDASRSCKATNDCKNIAEFIKGLEQSDNDDDSIWGKLRAGYCDESPSGTYSDLQGNVRNCNLRTNAR